MTQSINIANFLQFLLTDWVTGQLFKSVRFEVLTVIYEDKCFLGCDVRWYCTTVLEDLLLPVPRALLMEGSRSVTCWQTTWHRSPEDHCLSWLSTHAYSNIFPEKLTVAELVTNSELVEPKCSLPSSQEQWNLMPCVILRNLQGFFLWWEFLAPPNPKSLQPPIVRCLQRLLHYIRSLQPYRETLSFVRALMKW